MSLPRQYPSELSPYWLESSFEIRQVLKTLAKKSEKIALSSHDGLSFITVVLDVSDKGEVILDANAEPSVNSKTCSEPNVSVHGVLDRVDIEFKLSGGRMVEYDGAPALLFQAPTRLHKLQRREYFRIPTPMVKPLMCTLNIPVDDVANSGTKEQQAQVLDISIGGICIQQPVGVALHPGQVLKGCGMLIPESGVLRFDLNIRHVFDVENRLGKISRRAGCEFSNLSAIGQQAVQKFMSKLERDRRSVLS
jgi:c-di-GMP-binding flagellar brake protein YcgR